MKTIVRTFAALFLCFPVFATEPTPAGGEFGATATVTTRQGTRSMSFDVIVTNPMSIEQAQPYKRVLAEGGQQALVNAIRGSGRGRIRLGAFEYPVDLVVAEKRGDADRYYVVTARALKYEEVQDGSASLEHPFTVMVFDVPSFGKGDGRIYTKAALSVDDDGHVKAQQYDGDPGTLKDVRRIK